MLFRIVILSIHTLTLTVLLILPNILGTPCSLWLEEWLGMRRRAFLGGKEIENIRKQIPESQVHTPSHEVSIL